MKNQWNKVATETPPDLEYEALSIRVPQWEQKVAAFILERKPMKYYINEMPVLPEVIDWTVERSCSLFQFKDFSVAAAGGADFGCEEFLEGNAFG